MADKENTLTPEGLKKQQQETYRAFLEEQSAIQTKLPGDEGFDAAHSLATPHLNKPEGDADSADAQPPSANAERPSSDDKVEESSPAGKPEPKPKPQAKKESN